MKSKAKNCIRITMYIELVAVLLWLLSVVLFFTEQINFPTVGATTLGFVLLQYVVSAVVGKTMPFIETSSK